MSKLDSIIEAMEDYLAGCRTKAFSASKIEVERDRMEEFLAELKTKYPDEVKKAQKIIANHDDIINEAEERAKEKKEETEREIQRMINEHDIVKQATAIADNIVMQAQEQADQIIASAQKDAEDITAGAISYTDNLLSNMEGALTSTLDSTQAKFAAFVESCESSLKQVRANRAELNEEPAE
jgi:cell division septum initiation protein DivIVA